MFSFSGCSDDQVSKVFDELHRGLGYKSHRPSPFRISSEILLVILGRKVLAATRSASSSSSQNVFWLPTIPFDRPLPEGLSFLQPSASFPCCLHPSLNPHQSNEPLSP